jgi:ribonuclease Z
MRRLTGRCEFDMVQRGPAWQEDLMQLDRLSHLVTRELQGKKGEDLIIARTRAAGYNGPLLMGVDRMTFEITDGVKVIPPRTIDDLQNLDSKGQPFP